MGFYSLHFHMLWLRRTLSSCSGWQTCAATQKFFGFAFQLFWRVSVTVKDYLHWREKGGFPVFCVTSTHKTADCWPVAQAYCVTLVKHCLSSGLFPSSVRQRQNHFSPRWGEQLWCTCVLWDLWQGATEIPIHPSCFRCTDVCLKDKRDTCVFWR